MVGVSGLEPEASWSRTKRATSCAIPRSFLSSAAEDCLIILGTLQPFVKPVFPALQDFSPHKKTFDKYQLFVYNSRAFQFASIAQSVEQRIRNA